MNNTKRPYHETILFAQSPFFIEHSHMKKKRQQIYMEHKLFFFSIAGVYLVSTDRCYS